MNYSIRDLEQGLLTGFIDKSIHSKKELIPQILINDKSQGLKVLSNILDELKKCDEFCFSVAFITTSGVATLINTLEELSNNNIKGKILVSQYLNFTQPEALRRLKKFDNINLKILTEVNFHSKGYLFKRDGFYSLIIGSSNLTASALCENKELNLKVSATANSDLIHNFLNEFYNDFNNANIVDENFIQAYQIIYDKNKNTLKTKVDIASSEKIIPNKMQVEALKNIIQLREDGKNKALLISATGTGKTYLSAFDVKIFNPKRFLFIVHRANIAKKAMDTYKIVFDNSKTFGLYSGQNKELDKQFIFATIQTLSRDYHLHQFEPDAFDYIVIDETHRAGALTYAKILNYFKPKFLLGMTATPERTDGLDIFELFDHNIAYEIRLHHALEEKMLSPFHYYGVTDITVDGKLLDEDTEFQYLTSEERINRIIEKTHYYGCDDGNVRGLIFCSRKEECKLLSEGFNISGYNTVALTGDNTEEERSEAIDRLEQNNPNLKLDYIFTVDIFNEGIDIPRVNQVIMLRPTQSAIIFVQQLGRGLRKLDNKEYLTVIDFIGNYKNNYLVPIALYGDTSYNKDSIRKFLASGSRLIPGTSTINFDKISRDRIFEAIDSANMQTKKALLNDYNLLKFKLGRIPTMMDFITHGSRDPYLYVNYSRSYYNFVKSQEFDSLDSLNNSEVKILELFAKEINNGKRVEESLMIDYLLDNDYLTTNKFKQLVLDRYGYKLNDDTIKSCINNLNFEFVTETKNKMKVSVREIYNLNIINIESNIFSLNNDFKLIVKNKTFKDYLIDNITYGIYEFENKFKLENYFDGFILYRKYSRKDVFRILNWQSNPVAQNVGGYIISPDKSNCAIFVNYHKEEGISDTTKYEDRFLNNYEFEWYSKSKRKLNSPDVASIREYREGLRLPLFIKKSNDEGTDFYYMGDVTPIDDSFKLEYMETASGQNVSVVQIKFNMNQPVSNDMYDYITDVSLSN